MAFAGIRGTGDWGTDERPKNFRNSILWEEPNGQAPLTALLGRMAKESVNDPEFNWWTERNDIIRVATAADLNTTSTAVTLSAGGLALVPGDVLLLEKTEVAGYDNEIVTVSSVTDDTTIAVMRGRAGTSAANFGSGGFMTKIGSVFAEGTGAPPKSTRNPVKLNNLCQIFKTSMGITNTAGKTYARTGNAWDNDKKRKMFDHATQLEQAFLWGKKHETTGANGKPLRFTGGLRQFLTSNRQIYTTSPTADSFVSFMQGLYNYTANGIGDERIIFAGNGFINNLNKLAVSQSGIKFNNDGVIKLYGMNLQRWVFPFGYVGMKSHPLMNVHPRFQYSAFIIHGKGLKYRPLRDTLFKDNPQANDVDAREAYWLTEVGLEVHHEVSMGYIGNFQI